MNDKPVYEETSHKRFDRAMGVILGQAKSRVKPVAVPVAKPHKPRSGRRP